MLISSQGTWHNICSTMYNVQRTVQTHSVQSYRPRMCETISRVIEMLTIEFFNAFKTFTMGSTLKITLRKYTFCIENLILFLNILIILHVPIHWGYNRS